MCTEAVDLLMSAASTGAYFNHAPMQRAFRDMHMAHSHGDTRIPRSDGLTSLFRANVAGNRSPYDGD